MSGADKYNVTLSAKQTQAVNYHGTFIINEPAKWGVKLVS